MLLAAAPWWESWGERIIWVAAVLTALTLISRTKVAKWLWRQLVSAPLSTWGTGVVSGVVDTRLVPITGRQEENLSNQANLQATLNNIHACIDTRFTDTHMRIEKLTAYTEEVLAEAIGAKERIRQLYRALEVPVFETDSNGWATYVNPAYANITGLTVEDSLGEGWAQAIHPDDRHRVFSTWEKAVEAKGDFSAVYRFRNVVTGVITEVRGTAAPLHDAHREIVGWVGTLDPIGTHDTLATGETEQT